MKGEKTVERLYDRLRAYSESDYYGFHMPGHKRMLQGGCALPFGIDITEIEGFDDLHHASGILKEAQERAARVFRAEETHFLINGSTVGILSAILGSTHRGDKILVSRHCHKSVHHAIELNGLNPRYLFPRFEADIHLNGEVTQEAVEAALAAEPDIRAVVIVSPTYDGVVSDVEAIARTVHAYGIPLIVDEAHGAHFGFHPYFPQRASELGADIVIQSLHKTLTSLTQTALLHFNGKLADRDRVRRYLDMLQSSSPSYVLMASLDACVDLLEKTGRELFEPYVKRLETLRGGLRELRSLKLLETAHYDKSKVVISTAGTGISSRELSRILLESYHLQMEMTGGTYVVALTSLADSAEGFSRLEHALREIDRKPECCTTVPFPEVSGELPLLEQRYTPVEAREKLEKNGYERVSPEESAGCVAASYIYLYPPGSPIAVPGEVISPQAAELLCFYRREGLTAEGLEEGMCKVIRHG